MRVKSWGGRVFVRGVWYECPFASHAHREVVDKAGIARARAVGRHERAVAAAVGRRHDDALAVHLLLRRGRRHG